MNFVTVNFKVGVKNPEDFYLRSPCSSSLRQKILCVFINFWVHVQVDQLINQGHSFPKIWAGMQIMSIAISAIMCVVDLLASFFNLYTLNVVGYPTKLHVLLTKYISRGEAF